MSSAQNQSSKIQETTRHTFAMRLIFGLCEEENLSLGSSGNRRQTFFQFILISGGFCLQSLAGIFLKAAFLRSDNCDQRSCFSKQDLQNLLQPQNSELHVTVTLLSQENHIGYRGDTLEISNPNSILIRAIVNLIKCLCFGIYR